MTTKKNDIVINEELGCAVLKIHSNTHGKFDVLIDLEDVDLIECCKWSINKFCSNICEYGVYYAVNNRYGLMHRFITNCENSMVVDHINHNTIDNRRSNLRICTFGDNRKNNNTQKNNSSGRKGVNWCPHNKLNNWMANIRVNKKLIHIGYFKTFEAACKAREMAEIKYFGEFNNTQL